MVTDHTQATPLWFLNTATETTPPENLDTTANHTQNAPSFHNLAIDPTHTTSSDSDRVTDHTQATPLWFLNTAIETTPPENLDTATNHTQIAPPFHNLAIDPTHTTSPDSGIVTDHTQTTPLWDLNTAPVIVTDHTQTTPLWDLDTAPVTLSHDSDANAILTSTLDTPPSPLDPKEILSYNSYTTKPNEVSKYRNRSARKITRKQIRKETKHIIDREKYITNLSSKNLTPPQLDVLSLGLKFVPNKTNSHKRLLKSLDDFERSNRLKHFFANTKFIKSHPFKRKSNWIPPPASPTIEAYLKRVKAQISTLRPLKTKPNLTPYRRQPWSSLAQTKP